MPPWRRARRPSSAWCSHRTTRRIRSASISAGAADGAGDDVPVIGIESWATEPAFIEFLADDLAERRAAMRRRPDATSGCCSPPTRCPQRIIDAGDPYPDQLRSTAVAVAERLGIEEGTDWSIAWQSAGRTPEPWIGPDILQVIDELAALGDVGGVIVCACGFVADHLEVLYDLDIEAAARAAQAGLAFDRTASVNGDPGVMAALAERVIAAVDADTCLIAAIIGRDADASRSSVAVSPDWPPRSRSPRPRRST